MGKQPKLENECRINGCSLLEELDRLREQCRRLEELSYVDALTGLYNFRYMQRALEMEMERSRRTKLPTGLIMMDLDHFKKINTQYGHESGNTALAWVGKILRESIRVIDVACRYGGEEFALILPGTSLAQSIRIADRLREIISENPVLLHQESVTLTASFGVSVFRFTDGYAVGEFVDRADGFLYQAKSTGRNRVCSEELPPMFAADEVTAEEKGGLFAPLPEDEEI